ncbi:MAG TPA: hypothetical protein VG796_06365 [Verrucomicrobiales bacterium]|jgi:hypothetical protein|nr:hypothetical protein [Verrucomicrobiales bacterium]
MKLLLPLLVVLLVAGCDRQKKLSDEEKAAQLSRDSADTAEKLATGRDKEAREDLIKKAKEGK